MAKAKKNDTIFAYGYSLTPLSMSTVLANCEKGMTLGAHAARYFLGKTIEMPFHGLRTRKVQIKEVMGSDEDGYRYWIVDDRGHGEHIRIAFYGQ